MHFGNHSNTGEIAVFNLEDFVIQCRMSNKPYDFFGTWYNDNYLLSGDLRWLAHLVSTSIVWLNRASQEADSEFTSIMNRMFRFYNRSASSIRSITVANCLAGPSSADRSPSQPTPSPGRVSPSKDRHETGNPVSHRDLAAALEANSVLGSSKDASGLTRSSGGSLWPADSEFQCWRRDSPETSISSAAAGETETDEKGIDESDSGSGADAKVDAVEGESSEEEDDEDDNSEEVLDSREKFLIFTMGSRTYTPHQIGLKRILPFTFCRRIDVGPSLAERVAIRQRAEQALRESQALGLPPPEPVWHDYEAVADRFDPVDHIIDLNGHIIGMGLSPDHRYLYVNVRPWPPGCVIENPLQPPPIAQEIDIHVIDLTTFQQVGSLLRAHRSFTPNDECFFIFLDVSNDYVASGAEDRHGYLWDRHYGVCLAKFPHHDVVNSVAFNPKDPEMLITASDDFTLKIWRSRRRARELLSGEDSPTANSLPIGVEYRRRKSRLT